MSVSQKKLSRTYNILDFQHLENIAIKAALAAGKIIQNAMNEDIKVEQKKGGSEIASQVVTQVDFECEHIILSYLKPTCETYNLGLLTEEAEDNKSRFAKDYFWCIDPMDGTLPFIKKQPGFSVAIALVDKNGTPKIGVVYDPSTKNLYYASEGNGAFKNGQPWHIKKKNEYLTYVTDKKLVDTPNKNKIIEILNEKTNSLGLKTYKELTGAGSVLNAIYVIENTPSLLIKLPKEEEGGGSLWDFAATACIFKELELKATNSFGKKLDLNRKDSTFMNHEGVFYESIN